MGECVCGGVCSWGSVFVAECVCGGVCLWGSVFVAECVCRGVCLSGSVFVGSVFVGECLSGSVFGGGSMFGSVDIPLWMNTCLLANMKCSKSDTILVQNPG